MARILRAMKKIDEEVNNKLESVKLNRVRNQDGLGGCGMGAARYVGEGVVFSASRRVARAVYSFLLRKVGGVSGYETTMW